MTSYRQNFMSVMIVSAAAMIPLSLEAVAADIPVEPAGEFHRAIWDDATFTFHLRSYLLDRYDDPGSDPAAWALGGWAGYQTGWIGNVLQLGVVGYTSQPLWAPEDRDGTLLLLPGQEGYSVLGQAYAALKYEEQVLTLYRQIVNEPEVNPQDNRMTPNTFEGGSLGGDIGPVSYYAGVLTAMKKRNAIDFVNIAGAAGVAQDEVMYLGSLEVSPIEDAMLRSSLYVVPNLLASSYSDATWSHELAERAVLRLSGQFMIQSGIGEELMSDEVDAWVAGVKGDFTYGALTLTVGYTMNGEDNAWKSPYGSWPGYTSMIVEDFDRAEEQALLLGASVDFGKLGAEGLSFTALAAITTDVASDHPEQSEYDFTADYRFSRLADSAEWSWLSPLWLRARYALIEKDETDTKPEQQRDDFRLILNYELQFQGQDL